MNCPCHDCPLASRIHAFNASARPSAIPSAYWPRPSKASLFRRLPSALLTAIKSASFPMALLRGFLDRHPPRRKHRYYTKISGVCGRTQLSVQDANLAPCTFLLGKLKHKVSKKWAASCYQTFEVFFVLMAAARTNGRARPQIGFGFVSSSSMMSIWLSPFRRNGAGQYKLYCGPIFQ